VGLVGVGAVAQVSHIPALKKLDGVQIVALVDRDPEKASRVAQKFGVPHAYGRIEELLDRDDIDVVDLCTPNFLHAPMAIASLESGKHVICERPLARSADEATAMAKAAKKADRQLLCAVQHRFAADAQLLRTIVAKGDIGEIFHAKAGWLRRRTEWDSDEWRQQNRASGGGVVLDLGFQMVDQALWTLGNPTVVSVAASVHRSRKGEVEDSATAFFRLESGAVLTLELTWGLLMEKDFAYLNLFGSGGAALLNPFRLHKGMHGSLVNVTPEPVSPRNPYRQAVEAQMAHFADCLRKGTRAMGSPDEIVPVMQVLDAVYRSAELGKEVRLA
jgi:predicted dehydrogenase